MPMRGRTAIARSIALIVCIAGLSGAAQATRTPVAFGEKLLKSDAVSNRAGREATAEQRKAACKAVLRQSPEASAQRGLTCAKARPILM